MEDNYLDYIPFELNELIATFIDSPESAYTFANSLPCLTDNESLYRKLLEIHFPLFYENINDNRRQVLHDKNTKWKSIYKSLITSIPGDYIECFRSKESLDSLLVFLEESNINIDNIIYETLFDSKFNDVYDKVHKYVKDNIVWKDLYVMFSYLVSNVRNWGFKYHEGFFDSLERISGNNPKEIFQIIMKYDNINIHIENTFLDDESSMSWVTPERNTVYKYLFTIYNPTDIYYFYAILLDTIGINNYNMFEWILDQMIEKKILVSEDTIDVTSELDADIKCSIYEYINEKEREKYSNKFKEYKKII